MQMPLIIFDDGQEENCTHREKILRRVRVKTRKPKPAPSRPQTGLMNNRQQWILDNTDFRRGRNCPEHRVAIIKIEHARHFEPS